MRRTLTLVAGAVVMIGLGGSQAVAASRGEAVAASGAALPKGFLLYEAKAAGPSRSWETWKVSDRLNRRLQVNPCDQNPGAKNRSAARTITYSAETDYLAEQVVVYGDETAARKAMSSVRADLKRCARVGIGHNRYSYKWKNVGIGDEALRVGGFFFETRMRYVVVRKGKALVVYAQSGDVSGRLLSSHFRLLEKDARTMAGKVCGLRRVCA
jgi:hypothetical protein